MRDAIEAMRRSEALRGLRVSTFCNTPAFGPVQQPDFLNGAVAAESTWGPEALLGWLHGLEAGLGLDRRTKQSWGPRRIDLDLILVDTLVRDTPFLRLPHPGLTVRRFVLEPILELAPSLDHPISGQPLRQYLAALL